MERKKLLVTGCGRSGTFYAAEVWRSLGLDIRHERPVGPHGFMGRDGAASWFMAVDDSNPPFGPSTAGHTFDFTLHLVRHPLNVIASFAQSILQHGHASPVYIEHHAPKTRLNREERALEPKKQLILRAARYWYHWNLLAQARADETVQVEKLTLALPRLSRLLSIEYERDVVDTIPKDVNARWQYVRESPWIVTWREIEELDRDLSEKIRDLAVSYGY